MLRPYNPELDIYVFDNLSIIDYGDAPWCLALSRTATRRSPELCGRVAEAGIITLGIGGDHSIALAELCAGRGAWSAGPGPVRFAR